ncbi:MAG: acyl-CoA dehydrogenase family protein [Gammaproteobacteria bacterium]|nr:acyl-CoA dehydrogenase family protein [Gammaproteobacteria bacterium]MDH3466361.1 acyl-CoA dehydrogenase family protein [Gammaproteobacteria bacterium]
MNFQFSDEQTLIRDSISRFLADEYAFDRRLTLTADGLGYSDVHWQQFAELGWLALPFAEQYGGLDATPVETMIIMEQFGRGLMVSPYLSTIVFAGQLLANAGSEEQCETILPDVITGDRLLACAYAEPQSRRALSGVSTRAERDGDIFVINGDKSLAIYAECAHTLIVSARTSGVDHDAHGVSLFLVDTPTAGISMTHHRTHDGSRASDITLHNVTVSADKLIGELDNGLPALDFAIDVATAAVCAEASGAMWAVYEQTLAYLKTREQFGQTLGSLQALQHRLVDVYTSCELAQSAALDATLHLGADPAARRRAVSAAKVTIANHGKTVGQEGVQLHGGVGMTMELPIGHYLKRLTAINAAFGDANYHLRRYQNP